MDAWASASGIKLPIISESCEHPYHIFYLLIPSLEKRTVLIKHLEERSVNTGFHYVPLYLSSMGKIFSGKTEDYPVTENVSDRLFRPYIYNDLDIEALDFNSFYDF